MVGVSKSAVTDYGCPGTLSCITSRGYVGRVEVELDRFLNMALNLVTGKKAVTTIGHKYIYVNFIAGSC